jgi:hypothetical protein
MREETFPSFTTPAETAACQSFSAEDSQTTDHARLAQATFDQEQDVTSIQERHPDWPILHVRGYFSRHTPEDQQGIANHIRGAHVYMPETPGFEAAVARYQLAADAPNTKSERFYRRKKPIDVALLGTHIAVGSMDLRGSVPEEKQLLDDFDSITRDSSYLEAGTYNEALTNTYDHYKQFATLNNQREDGMPQRFEEQMATLLDRFPNLMEMPSLDVQFSLGAMHGIRLNQLLPAHGIPISRDFPMNAKSNYVFNYTGELVRTFGIGREPSEALLKRAYTERIIDGTWENIAIAEASMPDGMPYERLATSVFNDEQMEHLYEMVQATEKKEDWNDILAYINTVLVSNNIPALPCTKKEVEEATRVMLARQKSFAPQQQAQQEVAPKMSPLRVAKTVLKLAAVVYASNKGGCYQSIRP